MDKNKEFYEIKTDTGIIVAMIPASYIELYKKATTKAATKTMYQRQPASSLFVVKTDNEQLVNFIDRNVSQEILSQIELDTKIHIESEAHLEQLNEYYRRFGFLTASDYILFYITKQIEPFVKTCQSCKQYHNGTCLTLGYAMCGSNWGCKNFV